MSATTFQQVEPDPASPTAHSPSVKMSGKTLTDLPPELIELIVLHIQLDHEERRERSKSGHSNAHYARDLPSNAFVEKPNDPSTIYSMNWEYRREEFCDVVHFSSVCRYIKQVTIEKPPYQALYLRDHIGNDSRLWGYQRPFLKGIFSGLR